MQAIVLAAGKGQRLGNLGENVPKVMLTVCGKRLIDRFFKSCKKANIQDIIFVVGYKSEVIIDYVNKNYTDFNVNFVDESKMALPKHNNIYSLFLTKDLINDDVVLIESDLLYSEDLLLRLSNLNHNVMVVSKKQNYMNGTCVNILGGRVVKGDSYKTVNIYKFEKDFLLNTYFPLLEDCVLNKKQVDIFYETPLLNLLEENIFIPLLLDSSEWFEIDSRSDYDIANIRYADPKTKYELLQERYGGFWQIPEIIDCCYLRNPFFENCKIFQTLKDRYEDIIHGYSWGNQVNIRNASLLLDIKEEHLLVGNGATEFIQAISKAINLPVVIPNPTFNEYKEHFKDHKQAQAEENERKLQIIVNPNNPDGRFIDKKKLTNQIETNLNNIFLIDETFLDFAEPDLRFSLINDAFLENHKNVIVIKSLGKSYDINGLKLGILATANEQLLQEIKDNLYSWNLNAFASLFLQEIYKYKNEYISSCNEMSKERDWMLSCFDHDLNTEVINTQANFIVLKLNNISTKDFCIRALDRYKIFIKDLDSKMKDCIRVSINNHLENEYVIKSLKEIIGVTK